MPPVIAAVAAYAASQAIATLVVSTLVRFAITIVVSIAISALTKAMTKKPKAGATQGASDFSRDRTVTVKQPIAPWRIVYGEARTGGIYTYVKSTDNNSILNLVVTLSGHTLSGFRDVLFDDQSLQLVTGAGSYTPITTSRYYNHTTIYFGDGENDDDLLGALRNYSGGEWTTAHTQRGRGKLFIRLTWNVDIYPTGIPNISVIALGKSVYDPRTTTTAWHHNPALCLADYLTDTDYGLSATYATEIDEDSLIAAANICDEMVTVADASDAFTLDATTDLIIRTTSNARCNTGDRVQLATTGSLSGTGLATATDYYFIRYTKFTGKLATSYANAIAGTAIDLTGAGTGTHTLTRKAEPRYSCNGTFETDEKPYDIIQRLLTSMAGKLVYSNGKWKIYAGAYLTPTVTLDESSARKGIIVNTRVSRRENFNAVKGVYTSPYDSWQPTDFPAITNTTYLSEDNDERTWRDVDLAGFTISHTMAQRLAKIELEKARQQISVSYPGKFACYQLEPPDTVMITNSRRGWSSKVFEVIRGDLISEPDPQQNPILGYDLFLRETASAVYDWNSGEETTIDPAPDSDLPNPFLVVAPGAPAITEETYVTRDGAGVKSRAIITWEASTDGFLRDYQLEYKLSVDSEYTVFPRITDGYWELLDLAPGTYDFRVKAINELGVSSAYSTSTNRQIYGLAGTPADVSGLTISAIGGLAILRWTQATDVDVKIGGKVIVRHSPATSGALWNESVSIGDAIPGTETVAVLPLKAGSYLVKFVDGSNVQSVNATVVTTKQATSLTYGNVSTVTESPSFSGTHSYTVGNGTYLTLSGAGLFDAMPSMDAVTDIDLYGGIATSGTYSFSSGFDFGTSSRRRLTSAITAQVININDLVDSRTADVDSWQTFDGTAAAVADAQVWIRNTDNDPAGTGAVWTDWQRLDSAEFFDRGHQLQARLSSDDPAYNIRVTGLSVTADEVT